MQAFKLEKLSLHLCRTHLQLYYEIRCVTRKRNARDTTHKWKCTYYLFFGLASCSSSFCCSWSAFSWLRWWREGSDKAPDCSAIPATEERKTIIIMDQKRRPRRGCAFNLWTFWFFEWGGEVCVVNLAKSKWDPRILYHLFEVYLRGEKRKQGKMTFRWIFHSYTAVKQFSRNDFIFP